VSKIAAAATKKAAAEADRERRAAEGAKLASTGGPADAVRHGHRESRPRRQCLR
jgi:hypothetical protein